MNVLLRLRKDMVVTKLIPFKYLLYAALLSDVTPYYSDEDKCKYGIFAKDYDDLFDDLSAWTSLDDRKDELLNAINELIEEELIFLDDSNHIYLGEFRGKKFFPFEVKNSLYDKASALLKETLDSYKSAKSAKMRSRGRYLQEQIDLLLENGVEKLTAKDFTDLHGYLYELYTGGETYIIRNKVEYFQTNNILKAYDKFTTFALLIEGTLHFDKYRRRGMPTLTTVACIKDDVVNGLTRSEAGSKEYMREKQTDNGEF